VHTTRFAAAVSLFGLLVWATPAHAELVFFEAGRTMSIKSHRLEAGVLILTLRGGGEVACDPALVSRIAADEVPYPEPEVTVASSPDAPDGTITPFAEIIDRVSAREGVDPRLVRAVIQVESAYQPNARSPKGAMGLMQLMPATARHYAVTNPYDPAANIEAGIKHLKSLLARFPTALALAAYNAGDGAVARFGGIPPYAETRSYVSRILQLISRS
jgi:soluble lytic murein transglycosylase-like protein